MENLKFLEPFQENISEFNNISNKSLFPELFEAFPFKKNQIIVLDLDNLCEIKYRFFLSEKKKDLVKIVRDVLYFKIENRKEIGQKINNCLSF